MENMIDIGTLTSMKQLPVMQLNYGGAFTSMSSIEFDLGPMRCTGIWIHLKIVKSRCRNLSHPKQLKSYKGKSKPFPSELAQIERRNIKKRMASTTKIVNELQNKMNRKTLVAFRAMGAWNGHNYSHNYGSSGLNPGKSFS